MMSQNSAGIEKIESSNLVYALVLRHDFVPSSKYAFFSANEDFLQLGLNTYPSGETIKRHFHKPCDLRVTRKEECILIRSGKVRVQIYDDQNALIGTTILNAGDLIYFIRGGHGFDVLEKAMFLEVKQGPYLSREDDKGYF